MVIYYTGVLTKLVVERVAFVFIRNTLTMLSIVLLLLKLNISDSLIFTNHNVRTISAKIKEFVLHWIQ